MGGGGAVGLWANGNDAPDALSHYGYTVMGGMVNVEGGDLAANKYYNRATDSSADDHEISGYPTIEAFTGVSITCVTIYDMCKAVDKSAYITDIKLLEKYGGASGDYSR